MKTTCYPKWQIFHGFLKGNLIFPAQEVFDFINQGFESHGHVYLDKKGKGSEMFYYLKCLIMFDYYVWKVLIIWLKRFSSSQSTGPQSHSHLHHSWILSALMCRASGGSFLNLEAMAQVPLATSTSSKSGGPSQTSRHARSADNVSCVHIEKKKCVN